MSEPLQTPRDMLLASVGGMDRFESNFSWRTHYPQKRAASELVDGERDAEYGLSVLSARSASEDVVKEWLARFVRLWAAYQHAGARTANWAITGPANFPVERNRKRMEIERKRGEELMAFVKGAESWIARRERLAERAATVAADEGGHTEKAYGEVRVVLNKALDRVQIIFPDKPSDDERRILKSRAFRWAPSVGAWQRQLTQNGVWAAEAAMKDMGRAGEPA